MGEATCRLCGTATKLDRHFKNVCLDCLRRYKENLNSGPVRKEHQFLDRDWKVTPAELKKLLNQRKDI